MKRSKAKYAAAVAACVGLGIASPASAQLFDNRVIAARLSSTGSLDLSFGGNGSVAYNISGTVIERLNDAAIVPSTQGIVAAGTTGTQFLVMLFNSSGSLNYFFGSNHGIVTTSFPGATSAVAEAVAVDSAGRFVVAGHAVVNGSPVFAVARYLSNGNLDPQFGSNGLVLTNFSSSSAECIYDLAINSLDGTIVVAGHATRNGDEWFALARYRDNGSLDQSFDVDGKVLTDVVPGADDAAFGVDIDSQGRIVAAGPANGVFGAVRYKDDGSLDTTFHNDGIAFIDFLSSTWESVESLIIDDHDRPVLAGWADLANGGVVFAVARFTKQGYPDTAFDGDGKVLSGLNSSGSDYAYSVALSGGKIIVAGFSFDSWNMAVAQFTASGVPDLSFNNGYGFAYVNVPDYPCVRDVAQAVAIDNSGRVVLVGYGEAVAPQ